MLRGQVVSTKSAMTPRIVVWATVVAVLLCGTPASASISVHSASSRPISGFDDLNDPPIVRDKHPKLESRLSRVARAFRERGGSAAAEEIRSQGLAARGSGVRVIVEMTDRAGARSELVALSATVEAEYEDLAQVVIPASALERLAASTAIRSVRPPFRHQGLAVAGEGIAATGAASWHAAGITGAGTKVAVIDLGFAGYPARIASGDLPAGLTAVDMCSGQLLGPEPHGTAVAEIVHEMAPAAQLFLLCVETEVQLGLAKDYAKANGIGIVNHSVGWFGTSRGDGSGGPGTPDAIVADARANGILWVNAAGNHSIGHWQGFLADADADGWNEFVPGDETNDALLLAGIEFCASLKWDDWPVSSQDYDLYLYRLSDLVVVASSTNAQSPAKPVEELCYTSPSTRVYGVAIRRATATASPRFDLFVNNSTLQYLVTTSSIVEPASSPSAMAVGAICWQNSALELYSSLGPTIDGRIKPDIVGPDAVSTATYGTFSACAISGFAGTSASAPHVAGAAALAKQANAAFGPAELQSFLEGRAIDLGVSGKDNSYGAGRLALGAAPVIGGRGFGLTSSSGGAGMSWTGGTVQTGYLVLRLSATANQILPTSGVIPAAATAFSDSSVPSGLACYILVPVGIGSAPLALSDMLCLGTAVQAGAAPGSFTIRMNQSTNATLSWTAPGPQNSYLLVALDGSSSTDIPGTATSVTVPLGAASRCYVLVARIGTSAIGRTDVLCGFAGVSTFGSSSAPASLSVVGDRLAGRLRAP